MKNQTLSVSDFEVEPVSDEILTSVLGGLGEEDGITNSCSTSGCSNNKKLAG